MFANSHILYSLFFTTFLIVSVKVGSRGWFPTGRHVVYDFVVLLC